MWDTFHFTNCCPQDKDLNEGMWNTLEKKCRTWARKFGNVYIVTGPLVGDNRYGTIGDNNVVVPDAFFKAVMANDGKRWHTIAFVMQNRSYNENMQKCAMSVDELEELTGYDFFAALDDTLEAEAEKGYKLNFWKL
jgi:endonuclease G